MIVVRLWGGLGNQFFQYAIGRSLSLANQSELVFDLSWYYQFSKSKTPRLYELSRYLIAGRVAGATERLTYRARNSLSFRGIRLLPRNWTYFREQILHFDPSVQSLSGDIYLDGYWQSHRYFEGIEESIRKELTPATPFGSSDEAVRQHMASTNSISVHVRRGDYISNGAAAAYHGTCSVEYYQSAISSLSALVDRPHFFVFSDEPDWAKTNLSFVGGVTFVDHNGIDSAFQDLRLMSHCQHHIIANSSFSWWGAWLNPKPNKRVIAPRQWYADGSSTENLTPANWIRL